jgi:hypothetical protein
MSKLLTSRLTEGAPLKKTQGVSPLGLATTINQVAGKLFSKLSDKDANRAESRS